jgi:hypothetical protein
VKIETGAPEDHPTPLPLDTSATPAVVAATPRFPSGTEQGGVRDLAGERLSQLAASEAECAAAQTFGMSADGGRRQHYVAAMEPVGASATDEMALPPVPDNALPAAASYGYPYAGMEPTAAAAGWDYNADLPG